MQRNLLNTPAPAKASTDEKRRVARYLSQRPQLREAMKKAPPAPCSWWELLRMAETNGGIHRRPLLRVYL